MFQESDIWIEGVDYEELTLYIALTKTDEEIRLLGLSDYCPRRKRKYGQRPIITGCGVRNKKEDRFEPWIPARYIPEGDEQVKKRILTEGIKIIITFIMKHHMYQFNNEIRLQNQGGAIGVQLTGVLATVFMVWWDKQLKSLITGNGMTLCLYKRYVDDITIIVENTDNAVYHRNVEESEDQIIMKYIRNIGNNIHHSIQLEVDCPSKNIDNKLPILDLKVWLIEYGGKKKIMHEYYQKQVSSKAMVNARSAVNWNSKRTIIVQQILRVMKNCNKELPWENVCVHLNDMMMRIQYSGYDKKIRYEVMMSALKAYNRIRSKDSTGEQPMYRKKDWNRQERRKEKYNKKKSWYKKGGFESVIFVPATPKSELKKQFEMKINENKIKIKVIEKSGTTLQNILQTADPMKKKTCNRIDCPVCNTGGKGRCDATEANYKIECPCNHEYNGETARSTYTRGKQQMRDMNDKNEQSDLWKHCRDKHQGEIQNFKISVTETFKHDALLRQVSEAVKIRNVPIETSMNAREEYNIAMMR